MMSGNIKKHFLKNSKQKLFCENMLKSAIMEIYMVKKWFLLFFAVFVEITVF